MCLSVCDRKNAVGERCSEASLIVTVVSRGAPNSNDDIVHIPGQGPEAFGNARRRYAAHTCACLPFGIQPCLWGLCVCLCVVSTCRPQSVFSSCGCSRRGAGPSRRRHSRIVARQDVDCFDCFGFHLTYGRGRGWRTGATDLNEPSQGPTTATPSRYTSSDSLKGEVACRERKEYPAHARAPKFGSRCRNHCPFLVAAPSLKS